MFGRKKKKPTAADYAEALRLQAALAADKGAGLAVAYVPVARKQAQAAALAARAAAGAYGPVARAKALEAYSEASRRVGPAYEVARVKAQPYVAQAVGVAGPRVQGAVDSLSPRVDAAHGLLVGSWLPKVSATVASLVAASTAAKDQVVEVSSRAPDAVAVLKGDAVVKPKRGGKLLIGLGVLAAAGAAAAVLANRKPKDDPWATPSTTYTPPARTLGDRVGGVKEKASTVTSTATQRAAEVADKAKVAAAGATTKAKDVAADATTKVTSKAKGVVGGTGSTGSTGSPGSTESAPVNGTSTPPPPVVETPPATVNVLGDVADTASETAGDPAAEVAGAASDVKIDIAADPKRGVDKTDRVGDGL